MRLLVSILLTFALAATSRAASMAPFVFVMIDSQTETLHGNLPFNRELIAKAIDKLKAAEAKGIILKFFYDLPSNEAADRALEQSICNAPVALQSSLNDDEGSADALAEKFLLPGKRVSTIPELFSGKKAVLPLPRFARCASAIGFVDSTATEIPLLEVHQGRMVKSLHLVALEMASNQKSEIHPDGFLRLGSKRLDVMHRIDFPTKDSLTYIPLHEILSGSAKDWQNKVRSAVIVLGYDGKKIHSIETPLGPLGAHRFFITGLKSLANSFGAP